MTLIERIPAQEARQCSGALIIKSITNFVISIELLRWPKSLETDLKPAIEQSVV